MHASCIPYGVAYHYPVPRTRAWEYTLYFLVASLLTVLSRETVLFQLSANHMSIWGRAGCLVSGEAGGLAYLGALVFPSCLHFHHK